MIMCTNCKKCNYKISLKEVVKWLNSGIDDFKCTKCGHLFGSSVDLLIIYAMSSVPIIFSITYSKSITTQISYLGINIPEIVVVLFSILCGVIMMFSLGVLVTLIKNRSHRT